jgi:hypothetical protein
VRSAWRLLRTDLQTRLQLESATHTLVAALMLVLVSSAGNVRWINIPIGRLLRWPLIGSLCVLGMLYALTVARPLPRFGARAALAAAFALLALVSTSWSSYPHLSFDRALALAALLAAAAAVAAGAAGSAESVRQLLLALLVGVVAVALAGLVDLAFDPGRAVVPATTLSPARYQGLGANPNTSALVLALGLPLAVWAASSTRDVRWRVVLLLSVVLLDGSIVASGSRGPLLGALLGSLVVIGALPRWTLRARALAAGAAIVVFAIDVAVLELPEPAKHNPPPPKTIAVPVPLGPRDAEARLPLEDEIGLPPVHGSVPSRTLFTTSGRGRAWRGALHQARQRPIVGYAFGTEDHVFVDRYYRFVSAFPENSYIDVLLQLGAVGAVVLVALLGALVWPLRALRRLDARRRGAVAAAAGTVAAGLVVAVTQTYLIAPGSVGAAPFWLAAFVAAAAASTPQDAPGRRL